jgi:hypothetical protein
VYVYVCVCVYVYVYMFVPERPPGACVSVCVYVCVYVCMYAYVYVIVPERPAGARVCVCVCMYVCMYVMYVYVFVPERPPGARVCVCVCMCVCVCTCTCLYLSVLGELQLNSPVTGNVIGDCSAIHLLSTVCALSRSLCYASRALGIRHVYECVSLVYWYTIHTFFAECARHSDKTT